MQLFRLLDVPREDEKHGRKDYGFPTNDAKKRSRFIIRAAGQKGYFCDQQSRRYDQTHRCRSQTEERAVYIFVAAESVEYGHYDHHKNEPRNYNTERGGKSTGYACDLLDSRLVNLKTR